MNWRLHVCSGSIATNGRSIGEEAEDVLYNGNTDLIVSVLNFFFASSIFPIENSTR